MDTASLEKALGPLCRAETWLTPSVDKTAQAALLALSGDWLRLEVALRDCGKSDYLRSQCEVDKDAVKIVLWRDPATGISFRLHYFLGAGPERPHTHRWPFATHLLVGTYRHSIYVEQADGGHAAASRIEKTFETRHAAGDGYWMGPKTIHAVDADAGALSLFIRGPAVSNRTQVFDETLGDTYFHYGSGDENARTNRYTRKLTDEELDSRLRAASAALKGARPPA